MVYPEDRLRFDELMFRRGITVSNLGKNMASLYGRNGVVSLHIGRKETSFINDDNNTFYLFSFYVLIF